MELLYQLSDSEILKPLNAICDRDNECESTCCSSEKCLSADICQSDRYPLTIAVVVLAALIIIGGLIYYIVCMRKRRNTRFDSRLNSIVEPSGSQQERWVQDGINASVISKVIDGSGNQVDTINEEDREDFMQYKNYSNALSRSDSVSSESRGNVL